MSTANKFISIINTNSPNTDAYLDTVAELSKIDRLNHHQITEKGVPLVYDMMITVSTPSSPPTGFVSALNQVTMSGTALIAPKNWQTRNAVRMTYFTREELREEAGVSKGAIGKYAKTMRMNLDTAMLNIAYDPSARVIAKETRFQRFYAQYNPNGTDVVIVAPPQDSYAAMQPFAGGVWDYTQLSQTDSLDSDLFSDFYLNVTGGHTGTAATGYTSIGVIKGYNQRRQTVLDDSTVTSGGDTQFIVNDSPFFRIPQQDVSEDAYVDVTLDEQDNPPYDRTVASNSDSMLPQPAEFFQTTMQNSAVSFRIQAPLGLVLFKLRDLYASGWVASPDEDDSEWTTNQQIMLECEVLGTYEM